MRVHDNIRKCVGYVYCKTLDGVKVYGTCFFVGFPTEDRKGMWVYAVSAKHVIMPFYASSADRKVYLRVNRKEGGIANIATDFADWTAHPSDYSIDAMVCQVALRNEDLDQLDLLVYPTKESASEQVIADNDIGIGDDTFMVGLFSLNVMPDRNLPIIRHGNISLMDQQQFQTQYLGPVTGRLVETRSIGGLSGSPVFVHKRRYVLTESQPTRVEPVENYYLFGLMSAHWDHKPLLLLEKDSSEVEEKGSTASVDALTANINLVAGTIDLEAVNMGIGIVTPWDQIAAIIDSDEQKHKREQAELRRSAVRNTEVSVEIEWED